MSILSVKGIFKNNVAIPLEEVDITEAEVIIVFPNEVDLKTSLMNKYKEEILNYDFGLEPDEEYAKDLQEVYKDIASSREKIYNLLV